MKRKVEELDEEQRQALKAFEDSMMNVVCARRALTAEMRLHFLATAEQEGLMPPPMAHCPSGNLESRLESRVSNQDSGALKDHPNQTASPRSSRGSAAAAASVPAAYRLPPPRPRLGDLPAAASPEAADSASGSPAATGSAASPPPSPHLPPSAAAAEPELLPLPAELAQGGEPILLLAVGDLVQVQVKRPDGWFFGLKLPLPGGQSALDTARAVTGSGSQATATRGLSPRPQHSSTRLPSASPRPPPSTSPRPPPSSTSPRSSRDGGLGAWVTSLMRQDSEVGALVVEEAGVRDVKGIRVPIVKVSDQVAGYD